MHAHWSACGGRDLLSPTRIGSFYVCERELLSVMEDCFTYCVRPTKVGTSRKSLCRARRLMLLAAVTAACLSLAQDPTFLLRAAAQTRTSSAARERWQTLIASPDVSEFDLAVCIAAEESADQDVDAIVANVEERIAALAETARVRLTLATLVGSDNDPRAIATAVSTTLFGSDAPDDSSGDAVEAFFAGSTDNDYYDQQNSYLDAVLERRRGIPISLSLVYNECCKRLGLPMVGLNAPSHLLVAPADASLPFVVDPFDAGRVLDIDEAAELVATNTGGPIMANGVVVEDRLQSGRLLLASLRRWPMGPHSWAARMLRNLRAIHANGGDVVRTLGVAERLRLVAQEHPEASTADEQRDCAAQQAFCIWTLRWRERREEARALLTELGADAASERERMALTVLSDDWFEEGDELGAR